MPKLSRDDVLKLAKLARLELTSDEVEVFSEELSSIIDYFTVLETIDTTNLEPTYQVTGLTNVMREDKLIDYGYSVSSLLENVPRLKDDQIKVSRMVE